jgi:hypothetical protein
LLTKFDHLLSNEVDKKAFAQAFEEEMSEKPELDTELDADIEPASETGNRSSSVSSSKSAPSQSMIHLATNPPLSSPDPAGPGTSGEESKTSTQVQIVGSHLAPVDTVKTVSISSDKITFNISGFRATVNYSLRDTIGALVEGLGLKLNVVKFSLPHCRLLPCTLAHTLRGRTVFIDPRLLGGARTPAQTPLEPCELPDFDQAVEFDKLVFPILIRDCAKKAYDSRHFILCHWSDECQDELEAVCNTSQRKLLDRLQRTFHASSKSTESPWVIFCGLYDSFEFLGSVNPTPLFEYAANHYGTLLMHDWVSLPSPPNRPSTQLSNQHAYDRDLVMAKAVYIGGCRFGLTADELVEDLKSAMTGFNADWAKYGEEAQKQVFNKSHAAGTWSSITVPLITKQDFHLHPRGDEKGMLEILHGQPINGGKPSQYWIQPCPTQDIVRVQCSYVVCVLTGGGQDPTSAQLYHSVALSAFNKLPDDDRQKLLIVTVPLSLPGKGRDWLLKMSATVAYLLEPGYQPAIEADRLCERLFCGKTNF